MDAYMDGALGVIPNRASVWSLELPLLANVLGDTPYGTFGRRFLLGPLVLQRSIHVGTGKASPHSCVGAFGRVVSSSGSANCDALGTGVTPLQFPVPVGWRAVSLATRP